MEVAVTARRSLLSPLTCRTMVSRAPDYPRFYRCSLVSSSRHWKLTVKSSLNVPHTGQFGEPNVTGYLHMLSETLWKSLPQPVKDFPWKKAEDHLLHRLFHLGKKALKWFLVGFLLVSSASDIFFSLSRNMELLIPLGLFIGITVADFLVEISKELIESTTKDIDAEEQLLCIGTVFLCLNLVTRYMALPGRMVLSHMSSGGLLQALWLTEVQRAESERSRTNSALNVELQEPVA